MGVVAFKKDKRRAEFDRVEPKAPPKAKGLTTTGQTKQGPWRRREVRVDVRVKSCLSMQHYTDTGGYKAIGSQPTWRFLAKQPPCDHSFGADFTTLDPQAPQLAKRLLIPRTKLAYRFEFGGSAGLEPLPGGRGAFIFFSRTDYAVEPPRQVFEGATGL